MTLWRKHTSRAQVDADLAKVNEVLELLQKLDLRLDYFLYLLFVLEDCNGQDIARTPKHSAMVMSLLNGSFEYRATDIVEALYMNAVKCKYRRDDQTMPKRGAIFSPTIPVHTIRHAQPGLFAWAVWLTTESIQEESKKLTSHEAGLRLRGCAKRKPGDATTLRQTAAGNASTEPRAAAAVAATLPAAAVGTMPAAVSEPAADGIASALVSPLSATVARTTAAVMAAAAAAATAAETTAGATAAMTGAPEAAAAPVAMAGVEGDSWSADEWEGEGDTMRPRGSAGLDARGGATGGAEAATRTAEHGGIVNQPAQLQGPKRKRKPKPKDPVISWDILSSFSYKKLQERFEDDAPVVWHILNAYSNPTIKEGRVAAVRRRRPQTLASTALLAAMTFTNSNRASLYAYVRGVWLFACKAHRSIFRVDSRLGLCVAYPSVYRALNTMSHEAQIELRDIVAGKLGIRWVEAVGDNVQTFYKQRDPRIGRTSRMLKGFAGTVIEIEDFDPEAYRLDKYLELKLRMDRKDLTVGTIEADINTGHLENVAAGQFLTALVTFVPTLSSYKEDVALFYKENIHTEHQLPPTRQTKVYPLATNSADEARVEGMKEAVVDFLTEQLGIDGDTFNNRLLVFSGDGMTFEQLIRLVKNMSAEESNYDSLRFVVPMLELWHTRWTDLSRVFRAHAGMAHPEDPSTLAAIVSVIGTSMPPNLKKVPFFDGAHILDIALDAYLLNCWEVFFDTDDLVEYFRRQEERGDKIDFPSLVKHARTLTNRYATTAAYHRARHPPPATAAIDRVPLGSPWPLDNIAEGKKGASDAHEPLSVKEGDDSEMVVEDEEALSELSDLTTEFPTSAVNSEASDVTLASGTLFMRDAIWWREASLSTGEGDPGRIWEILKVWTLTFAGSGNTHYTQYLLELYCNFKWEFPPAFLKSVQNNMLVNLHGEPGRYIEKDLMQEHFNFWLEELAEHKGKEFGEDFYRNVLSMHVHQFLKIKEEMEDLVSLKAAKKKHGEPHLDNELRAAMQVLRQGQVNRRRPGRHMGFDAEDHFSKGRQALEDTVIESFIAKTTAHMNVGANHPDVSESDVINTEDQEDSGYHGDGTQGQRREPPRPLYVSGGQLMVSVPSMNIVDEEDADSDHE